MRHNLRNKVYYILDNYEGTRNDDIKLYMTLLFKFYADCLRFIDNQYYIRVADLYRIPKQADVQRWRARLQNEEGLFPPTDPEVKRIRRQEEKRWRESMQTGEEVSV